MSVMLYPCVLCVALLMCLCFVLRVCELFGCSCYFVVKCYGGVCGGAIDHVCSSKECACCACDPNELNAPSICFVCVFVCRKLSPHLGV